MSTLRLAAPDAGFAPGVGPIFRVSRGALLLLLGVIYAGCIQFFIGISPVLLNGTYLVIIGCLAVCLFFDWSASRNAQSVAPYLLWVFGYFLWGMTALSSDSNIFSEGVKMFIKNALVIGALAIAVEARTLRPFAQLVQLAVLGNFALCVWETANPELVRQIAYTREAGATAFNVLRPAGLWSNPDEAASAFIFSLLMARWAGGVLGWLGGFAAVAGIYLSASRTGAYLLAFCAVFQAWQWLRLHRIDSARIASVIAVLLLAGGTVAVVAKVLDFDPAEHWQLARFFDLTESTRDRGDTSRVEIAKSAVQAALDGPWYGHGLFTFQLHAQPGIPTIIDPPAHNIFLAVWGEAGAFVGLTYLLILGFGIRRVFTTPMRPRDRATVLLMWLCYLIIGLTWHNQFTSFSGMIYIALLWHLPAVLKIPANAETHAAGGSNWPQEPCVSRSTALLLQPSSLISK